LHRSLDLLFLLLLLGRGLLLFLDFGLRFLLLDLGEFSGFCGRGLLLLGLRLIL